MANNTILIVDDDPEILAYYWKMFFADDASEFDILGSEDSQQKGPDVRGGHKLLCHRLGDSFQFLEMFEKMVESDTRHPLCIIDMRMPGEDGQIDNRRGIHIAKRVRELDPDIHIVICTADLAIEADAVVREIGSNAHFFRKPFEDEAAFYLAVHSLVDEWNDKRRGASSS